MTEEHKLQKAIIDFLKDKEALDKDIYYIRNNSFVGRVVSNKGKTGWMQTGKKGSPDIILCHKGCWIGIEVKSEKGKQNKHQIQAEQAIRSAGGQYFVIRSIEEFRNLTNILGI